jgi:hypothetical protein
VKTTVEIDDELLRAAKRAAVDQDTSLRAIMERALRRELSTPAKTKHKPLHLVTVPGRAPDWIRSREKMWEWFDAHPEGEVKPPR